MSDLSVQKGSGLSEKGVEVSDDTVLDAEAAGKSDLSGLKMASDGHTILQPQPTDDPNDPLNWSWQKKHMILFIVAFSAFAGDFGSGAGIPCIVVQGKEWNMDPNSVNHAGNLNVIMLGIGGVFWIPFVYFWGRAPVLFWTTVAGALFTLGCAVTDSFPVFYGLRALMGFTLTACQTIGLAFIKDMFFFHEHARKIGIWASMFLIAPYCGPLFGNFIIASTGNWRIVFWVVFAVCCAILILTILFADETWYNRNLSTQPPRGTRFSRILGIQQIQHHSNNFMTITGAVARMTETLFKPVVIPTMIYYMLSFMWAVGINITTSILFETPQEKGGYGFSSKAVGFLYFTPVVSVIIGEAFGHFFNDFIANRYIRLHAGKFLPEVRLWTNYIAIVFMIPGLILVGQGLRWHLHWGVLVVGWGMYVFGVMTASVATTAYLLDSYHSASGEVAGWLNFARVVGGFSVGYFQMPWGVEVGYDKSFGTQAAIVGVALFILVAIQRFGPGLRAKSGPVSFKM